jgi:hypothetical protein
MLIAKIVEAGEDPSGSAVGMLKRMLLELRELTIRTIEDALEIEYRTQVFNESFRAEGGGGDAGSQSGGRSHGGGSSSNNGGGGGGAKLPPIMTYEAIDKKEDVLALADMVSN